MGCLKNGRTHFSNLFIHNFHAKVTAEVNRVVWQQGIVGTIVTAVFARAYGHGRARQPFFAWFAQSCIASAYLFDLVHLKFLVFVFHCLYHPFYVEYAHLRWQMQRFQIPDFIKRSTLLLIGVRSKVDELIAGLKHEAGGDGRKGEPINPL